MNLYFPENYKPLLDLKNTEKAIKFVKDFFQENLSAELRLRRVTAPLFVLKGTGVNDDLNGVERPVSFPVKEFDDKEAEVVQSLAKWKRMMLAKYGIPVGYGIYTDMNAIRADEELSNMHSLYVDQWDWEKVITSEQRSLNFLKKVVRQIYAVLLRTEFMVYENYSKLKPSLPDEITFIHAEELAERYPDLTPKEREDEAAKAYGAVFIIGIGGTMANGEVHDGRAPDYDDWSTSNSDGYKGLNGDIIVWNSMLNRSFELSSMGIRVDKKALEKQLKLSGTEDRKQLLFHKKLLKGELPLSIGGGIGQSRLCMYFLRKAHIGEVQASLWPEDMVQQCAEHNIVLV
ncbi:aspartate--ammonia ligase [Prolixibacter denitrificans]|uniref:Aspartate--ammonia ligase n=1 Tax=Prolixibacter denitrificans TaxID=1541063 RepID=A0A2P8CAR6_9BACT|nr:aspartate--ammonia ligase [Prolixibacter denitrificans]PSK82070.1 aspartate-ammonia ligase [Prolixibacter denitrificans]GET22662.1 aspartate--ammonia ligase [Prolixibacter denitrificans]